MEPDRLFDMVGWIAMPGWLLLAVLPRWRWTQTVTAGALPAILGAIYLALFVSYFRRVPEGFGAFGSLAGVQGAFSIDGMLLAGWIHYLAFDLFVGSWLVRDAQRVGVRHWFVLPCLFLTLMMGPVGLLAYLVLRGGIARRFSIPGVPADASASG
ncbi:MAG: ABA4-like family protein [Pirellulales bacterium]